MDRPAKDHEKVLYPVISMYSVLLRMWSTDKIVFLTPYKAIPGPKLSSQFSNSQRTSKTVVGSPSVSQNKYLHICQYDTPTCMIYKHSVMIVDLRLCQNTKQPPVIYCFPPPITFRCLSRGCRTSSISEQVNKASTRRVNRGCCSCQLFSWQWDEK